MEHLAVADGTGLHPGIALPAVVGKALEQCGPVGCSAVFFGQMQGLQHAAQCPGIFQRHRRALGQVGAHGVGGITGQQHPALGVLVRPGHGRAVVQRPQLPLRHGIDHASQIGVYRAECGQQVGPVGLVRPALRVAHGLAMHHHHQVVFAPAAHGVMHRVQPGAEPGGHAAGAQGGGHIGPIDQPPVGQVAREARRCFHARRPAGDVLAHHAPQAIAADERVGRVVVTRLGVDAHAAVRLVDAAHPFVQVEAHAGVRPHGLVQQLVRIGAVDGGVAVAVFAHRMVAQQQLAQGVAVVGIAHTDAVGKGGHRLQIVAQPPVVQHAHRIRPQLDARPHLAEGRCLLQHMHPHTGLGTRQRHTQATNATTGNQELLFSHGRGLCVNLGMQHLTAVRLCALNSALLPL